MIPPQVGSSRPRKYCVDCRPPRPKRPDPAAEYAPELVREPGASLADSYRNRLVEAGRRETPEGALVMYLASLLETGEHTAAGAAALARELRSTAEVALRDAGKTTDALDDLAARRAAKAAGA